MTTMCERWINFYFGAIICSSGAFSLGERTHIHMSVQTVISSAQQISNTMITNCWQYWGMHRPASTCQRSIILHITAGGPSCSWTVSQEPVLVSLKRHTPQIIRLHSCTMSSSAMTVFIQSVTSNNCCCCCQIDYRVRTPKELPFWRHYLLKSIWDSAVMINFPMVAQSPYYVYTYISMANEWLNVHM